MKLYLAGPMRGMPEMNFPAFKLAALRLRVRGHEVWSPAERDLAEGFNPHTDKPHPLKYYMQFDLPALLACEAMALLPLWEYSEGALLEAMVAQACAMPLLDASTLEPVPPQPALVAMQAVRRCMVEGHKKHPQDTWRHETESEHLLKAARHGLTARLIAEGWQGPDSEDHLVNILCRAAMALANREAAHAIHKAK